MGPDPSNKALREGLKQLDDMAPLFVTVGEYMLEATRERFIRGVSPTGVPWIAKKQSTLERYKKMGYGQFTKPLWGPSPDTTGLRDQVHYFSGRDYAVIGSAKPYAAVMQFRANAGAFGRTKRGGPIPWGRIPARAWLGISKDDERTIAMNVEEYLSRPLGGSVRVRW